MSTKIYYAYKYNGSLEELLSELKEIRRFYYKELLSYINNYELEKLKGREKINKVGEVVDMIVKEYGGNIVIYSLNSQLYCQFFCPMEIIQKVKGLSSKFEDYHYQNQTDRLSKIKVKDWKERERIWDKIFDDTSIPALDGLTFEILDKSMSENLIIDLLKVK